MALITPRASGFWTDARMSNYFPDDEGDGLDVEQQNLIPDDDSDLGDERTPLDKTIDRIGMGSYQWTLLSLCGFGWLADNMWIQAVAIILPRVQQHYDVPDSYIGSVSSAMFAGMMFGAIGWGTCSDIMGRSAAFNATLCFTAAFGLLASFTTSFTGLCVVLFFLGSAVGGSMPTDGTLLLEHMPKSKQYLVTALSVFFSVGAVLAAVVALIVIPRSSCLPNQPCNVDTDNQGWKHLLMALGVITLSMFIARIVFFRLHESPRYLVHAGRHQEAIESLQLISRFNGSEMSLEIGDVQDQHQPVVVAEPESLAAPISRPNKSNDIRPRATSTTIFSATDIDGEASSHDSSPTPTTPPAGATRPTLITQYNSTDATHTVLDGHTFATPAEEHAPVFPGPTTLPTQNQYAEDADRKPASPPPSPTLARPRPRRASLARRGSTRRVSSVYEKSICESLPRWLRRPLWAWWDRVMMVLSPEWLRTTLLVWAVWCAMSLAYTMFNVYLPKLLESGAGAVVIAAEAKSLEESLWDVVIFTIGGCPGAILGAYLIESPLGRRWSLAGSTFLTAFFCVVFVIANSSWAAMWAVLYGWTPEIFGTKVRGTACGIASALSRIGGMIAPLLGGALLVIDRSIPVYTSVVVFVFAGFCVLLLRENAGDSGARVKGERALVH
ncbi:hypothetical protein DXG01_008057 [Tephrocybe rancida]|nr:hypothetical protein DXG01_008057 [Tephrocybe rancida]